MTTAARTHLVPRYGSPAEVAAYLGVSTKTVRCALDAGELPSYRVGRRVLVAYRDADQFVRIRRAPNMSTVHRNEEAAADVRAPYVPPITQEELMRRNQAAISLLQAWDSEQDEQVLQDQCETMEVIREALGPNREASSRNLFP